METPTQESAKEARRRQWKVLNVTKHRRKWKPCLLCGENTTDWDYICRGCRADVIDGSKMRKWRTEALVKQVEEQERAYVLPRPQVFYYNSVLYTKVDRVDVENLPKKIIDILLELLSPAPASSYGKMPTVGKSSRLGYRDNRYKDRCFSFGDGQPALLNKLFQLIRQLSLYSYLEGKSKGEHFIQGLVNDEVSIDDLMKKEI